MDIESFNISYNARHLEPQDVAKSFIYTKDYDELIQPNHTVLLGARGCGKTTLMKMLTLPALYSWKNKRAKTYLKNLNFFTVYISTDIYWNVQKDAYNKQLIKFPQYSEKVSKVAVTTNVLFSLIDTFQKIIELHISNSDNGKEVELSMELIELWALPKTIPNLSILKENLIKRTDLLNRHIQKTVFNFKNDDEVVINEEYFDLDYDSSVVAAISIFERIYDLSGSSKWALCFDELELAPHWLQERLFGALRSRNQKILYKLSTSPIVSIPNELLLATPGNDLKLIKMWPHSNDDYTSFSEKLVKSLLKSEYGKEIEPELLLGVNPILKKEANIYKTNGEAWLQIKELAQKDKKLYELLVKHGIEPTNPSVNLDNSRKLDTVLRKIKPIVYFRNYYRNYDNQLTKTSRSRKAHTLFYGKEVLYNICDGNPRWLIGIVKGLLSKTSSKEIKMIPEPKQAEVFEIIAEQFFNVIKTIPEAMVIRQKKYITLSDIIDEIGRYFFQEIVLGDFKRDPNNTFIIDKNLGEDVIKILEKGVYQGAFILLDPADNAFDFELRGKRFRLSYIFCPKYKIPIRKYSAISLTKCLSNNDTVNQIKLGFE